MTPALGPGDLQFPLRLAQREVFRRVEGGEVLADDVFGGISLDALSAVVPADDDPGRVQHEKRVVAHVALKQVQHVFPGRGGARTQ